MSLNKQFLSTGHRRENFKITLSWQDYSTNIIALYKKQFASKWLRAPDQADEVRNEAMMSSKTYAKLHNIDTALYWWSLVVGSVATRVTYG